MITRFLIFNKHVIQWWCRWCILKFNIVLVKPPWACSWRSYEHLCSWKLHEHAHEAPTRTCAWRCHAHDHFRTICVLGELNRYQANWCAPADPPGVVIQTSETLSVNVNFFFQKVPILIWELLTSGGHIVLKWSCAWHLHAHVRMRASWTCSWSFHEHKCSWELHEHAHGGFMSTMLDLNMHCMTHHTVQTYLIWTLELVSTTHHRHKLF